MAVYTNVTTRLINLPDGSQCVPGQATEVSDEVSGNQGFKDLVDSGDIVAGEIPADKLEEARQERETKMQEAQQKAQEQARAPQAQQQQQPRQTPAPTPAPTTKSV